MHHCRRFCTAAAAIWAIALAASPVHAVGQEFIPLENWAYRVLERFEALGLCVVPADRPFTRAEFIALTGDITSASATRELSERDRYNLERLEREFTAATSRDDPRERYDPPLFYLTDAPLVLEGDVDLEPYAAQSAFGDEVEWFARSEPDIKLHAGERVTYNVRYRWVLGPEHGSRVRDEKPSAREKSFKGLTSLFERSYVIVAWDKVHAFVGREAVDWGPAQWGNLITPGADLTLDQLGLRLRMKSLRLSMFYAQLSPLSRRYLAGHRLETRWGRTVIGISETALYQGKQLDPVYAFPLSSFYANQFNERGNDDNIIWSADVKTTLMDIATVYASVLVDDFQFEREGDPDKIAFDAGATCALGGPLPATLRAKYRFVDAFTYTHSDSLTRYIGGEASREDGDALLGGAPGPDSDAWRVEVEVFPRDNIVATAVAFGTRVGAGNDFRVHTRGEDPNPPFPIPVVERTFGAGARLSYELERNRYVVGEVTRVQIDNVGGVDGVDDDGVAFRIAIHWEFL